MENRTVIKILIFTGVILITPLFSFAYEPETTHKALTQEIVKLLNFEIQVRTDKFLVPYTSVLQNTSIGD